MQQKLEGRYVYITNDARFEGVIGKVLTVSYVTENGVKVPLKARVKIVGLSNVSKSGFTPEYIKKHDLANSGLIILKDVKNLDFI